MDRLNQELEDRVKERTAGLERSNQDLQQFAFVASHDLQEPLRMVSSYLGLLSKSCQGKLDAEAEKYIGFAVDGSARMQALIRDLLAYAQVSTQAPVLTRTRLADVVNQARYALLASVRETGAEIATEPLPELEVDALKMSLVFQNLLSNAIKFRQPGGKPSIQSQPGKRPENGAYRCKTVVSVLTRSTPKRSLAPSSGCMARASIPAQESVWRFAAALSTDTAAVSGRSLSRVQAQRFISRCRSYPIRYLPRITPLVGLPRSAGSTAGQNLAPKHAAVRRESKT